MLRMGRKTGIKNPLYFRMLLKELRHSLCIALMLPHAYHKGLDTAKHQPAVEGLSAGTKSIDDKLQTCIEIFAVGEHRPANHIGMTVEILGGRMNDNIGSKLKRLLTVRRKKGVIHNGQEAPGLGKQSNRSNIDQIQQRIGRSLNPYRFRLLVDIRQKVGRLLKVHKVHLDPKMFLNRFHQPRRPAIAVISADDLVAGCKDAEGRGYRRHAGCYRNGCGAPFKGAKIVFERLACRVAAPGIIKSPVFSDILEYKGGTLVNRGHNGAVCLVRAYSGVNRICLKTHG